MYTPSYIYSYAYTLLLYSYIALINISYSYNGLILSNFRAYIAGCQRPKVYSVSSRSK